ncbi:MAG: hypothetical protein KGL75_02570, partial [Acidobacteriota bacterium]|nr:hypothetical protein [Acidobacteriota bacterium]
AQKLGCAFEADGTLEIAGVAGIDDARPGDLTFLSNRKYLRSLSTTRASAVLIAPGEACPKNLAALHLARVYACVSLAPSVRGGRAFFALPQISAP